MSRRKHLGSLLRAHLPEGLARRVRWSTLRCEPKAQVGADNREKFNDVVYEARMKDGGVVLFLVEHQSRVEWGMAERLRQYRERVRGWWMGEHPGEAAPLVVAVVLYHGRGVWTAPRSVEEWQGLGVEEAQWEEWVRYLERWGYSVMDLRQYSEEELRELPCTALVRLMLVLLRRASTEPLHRRLMELVDLFEEVYRAPGGEEELEVVLAYLRDGGGEETDAAIRRVLECFVPKRRVEGAMQSLSARDRAEGRKEGRVEGEMLGHKRGRKEGRTEGMAEALLRLLAARRIRVGESARQRILKCQDLAQLKRWFDRAVSARQLSEVLDDPAA